MIVFIARAINLIVQLITLLVIVKVFLSYFMSPYHPLRFNLDRIIDPLLNPIRRIIPSVGMLDLSPIVLLILIQLIGRIIVSLLLSAA
jgi:YggT family protein